MRKHTLFTAHMGSYPASFWLALVANAFFFFSFQTTFPVLPRFIADIVLNRPAEQVGGQVGLVTSALALIAVLTRVPAGRLTDRWGRHRFMLLGALCFVLAPLIYALSRDMPSLLLGRVIHGVGLGTFTTALQALVTELAPHGRRGQALGLAGASTSVAFMSAPVVGDWLALNAGYTLVFQMSAAAALFSAVMVLLITLSASGRPAPPVSDAAWPPHPGHGQAPAVEPEVSVVGLGTALAQTGVRAGVLTMAALGIPFGAFITFLPLFAYEQQVEGVGLVYSIYAVTTLFAQPLAGSLADRVGRTGVIVPGLLITALAAAVLSLDNSLAVFLLSGVVFGLGGGLVRGGIDPLVQDSVPPSLRGTAAAVQYTSFDFSIGAGSYPIGLLANAIGYALTFAVSGVVCVLGGGTLALLLRSHPKEM